MSDNNELLEKVVATSDLGAAGGGLLRADQANRFIDYMWDQTVLGGQVRTIRMRANEQEVTRMGVGERIMRLATEAVDDGINVGVQFAKISLTTKKLRLDWELTSESLEDNLEGDALEDHIARLMSAQAANDLEDLAINGDVTRTTDPLLKSFTGWRERAVAEGHVIDHEGDPLNRAAFNAAIRAMPRRLMQRRNGMKFFVGSNLIQDYLFSITEDPNYAATIGAQIITNGGVRAEGPVGFQGGFAFGIPYQEVPFMDTDQPGTYTGATGGHGDLILTFPQNLLWGVKREIQVFREFKPKKDTIEYTMYCRVGVAIENVDAIVVVTNIKSES